MVDLIWLYGAQILVGLLIGITAVAVFKRFPKLHNRWLNYREDLKQTAKTSDPWE